MTRLASRLLAVVICTFLAACASGESEDATLTVFVDTVLEVPVQTLTEAFQADHPEVQFEFETGTSEDLADRLRAGEEPDLFIGLRREVGLVNAEGLIDDAPLVLGSDQVLIVVPRGNPANITGLDAFELDAGVTAGICAEDTSCGIAARQLFREAGIEAAPSRDDIGAIEILTLLSDRELDVSILWRTHASASFEPLDSVRIPEEYQQRKDYVVAGVTGGGTVEQVVEWLATDPASEEILVARGLRESVGNAGP